MINFKFIVASTDDQDLRLDKFIKKYFSDIPYSIIQKKIRLGKFKVNSKKKSPSYKVIYLDKIYYVDNIVLVENKKNKSYVSEKIKTLIKKSIIYEDNYILILNKPYGIPVQGGSKVNLSIDDILPFLVSKKITPRLTHRIDKNTTGILIIAKSKEAAKSITKLFKEDKIEKIYWTITIGIPKNKEGVIKAPISKTRINGIEKMKVDETLEKEAITYYKILDTSKDLSLIEVTPKTGRTHQIRVHLLSKGISVLGDNKYRLQKIKQDKFERHDYRMHLHAKNIKFKLNNKIYSINAALPQHFQKTLRENKLKFIKKNDN
ncbi:MAG: Ribosomal large subunit pseudouridine synthase C [Alphaproteobacteria bacterium MarineAlpha9_Bin4]|nr:hypothetical protein [Pelagibacterales bacterium]PPR27112.1 MAG: Ribosomal large subunit pseudouridine synthase C [Alphaproteobacteria bacterium MarineAlpha9_Bin4]|tara:strand:+ start:1208 stop:2164 length:957 start_codon:yes stop_codon:yes gene_type:complete